MPDQFQSSNLTDFRKLLEEVLPIGITITEYQDDKTPESMDKILNQWEAWRIKADLYFNRFVQ